MMVNGGSICLSSKFIILMSKNSMTKRLISFCHKMFIEFWLSRKSETFKRNFQLMIFWFIKFSNFFPRLFHSVWLDFIEICRACKLLCKWGICWCGDDDDDKTVAYEDAVKVFENFSNKRGRKMRKKEVIKLFFGKFCLILLLIDWMYRMMRLYNNFFLGFS